MSLIGRPFNVHVTSDHAAFESKKQKFITCCIINHIFYISFSSPYLRFNVKRNKNTSLGISS